MPPITEDMPVSFPPTGQINPEAVPALDAPDILASAGGGALPAPTAKTSTAKGAPSAPATLSAVAAPAFPPPEA